MSNISNQIFYLLHPIVFASSLNFQFVYIAALWRTTISMYMASCCWLSLWWVSRTTALIVAWTPALKEYNNDDELRPACQNRLTRLPTCPPNSCVFARFWKVLWELKFGFPCQNDRHSRGFHTLSNQNLQCHTDLHDMQFLSFTLWLKQSFTPHSRHQVWLFSPNWWSHHTKQLFKGFTFLGGKQLEWKLFQDSDTSF